MINGILIVLLILICVFAVKGSAKRMIYGCCGGRDVEKKKKVADRDPSHYPYCAQIRVEGMSCNHCRIRVENSFNELNGVWAEVSLKEKQATVRMKNKIEEAALRRAVEKAGYEFGEIKWLNS